MVTTMAKDLLSPFLVFLDLAIDRVMAMDMDMHMDLEIAMDTHIDLIIIMGMDTIMESDKKASFSYLISKSLAEKY